MEFQPNCYSNPKSKIQNLKSPCVIIRKMQSDSSHAFLALTPLGAGDLIDRAIRLYRNNFWTFVWIASPPILLGTLITVGWTMLVRQFFSPGSSNSPDAVFFSTILNWFGNVIILIIEG